MSTDIIFQKIPTIALTLLPAVIHVLNFTDAKLDILKLTKNILHKQTGVIFVVMVGNISSHVKFKNFFF